ncbi:MAG TPA: hypothetical protein VMJ10_18845 [Kofleriaceae bacterium]|nr:hypothetical protein [Kofleriaceae bacterium]
MLPVGPLHPSAPLRALFARLGAMTKLDGIRAHLYAATGHTFAREDFATLDEDEALASADVGRLCAAWSEAIARPVPEDEAQSRTP